MIFLVVAVVLLAALCCFELLVLFAVLRRLREHEERFAVLGDHASAPEPYDYAELEGRAAPSLATLLSGEAGLVGFFDVNCDTCHDKAPAFTRLAPEQQAACAIVAGSPPDELVGLLDGVRTVVTGPESDKLVKELGIQAFPTFLYVGPTGVVERAGFEPADAVAPAHEPEAVTEHGPEAVTEHEPQAVTAHEPEAVTAR
ncbi:hypothetical protein [Streptomyces sp. NBC_01304]|uniref:hypothetical protein n=1 Tax=Streptomyces sp. NBC_01304 TaxID=2903818 RepID=UPI002E1252CE|nr:hypothetical protein OG430_18820 [Streptomyces sp. NBC_01304]